MSFLIASLIFQSTAAHAWFESFKIPTAARAPVVEALPTPALLPNVFRLIDDQTGVTCYMVGAMSTTSSTTISCVKTDR